MKTALAVLVLLLPIALQADTPFEASLQECVNLWSYDRAAAEALERRVDLEAAKNCGLEGAERVSAYTEDYPDVMCRHPGRYAVQVTATYRCGN